MLSICIVDETKFGLKLLFKKHWKAVSTWNWKDIFKQIFVPGCKSTKQWATLNLLFFAELKIHADQGEFF